MDAETVRKYVGQALTLCAAVLDDPKSSRADKLSASRGILQAWPTVEALERDFEEETEETEEVEPELGDLDEEGELESEEAEALAAFGALRK